MDSEGTRGGGDSTGVALDTSWLTEPATSGSSGQTRGRASKRRARRCTLSPSIGSKSFMSGVDFNDPESFPSIPLAGGSGGISSSGSNNSRSSKVDVELSDGDAGLVVSPPSNKSGCAEDDTVLPDPDIVAGLFSVEGTPESSKASSPLGVLEPFENKLSPPLAGVEGVLVRGGQQGGSSGKKRGTARPWKDSSSTAAGTLSSEVENLKPVLLEKPAAVTAAATATVKRSPPSGSGRGRPTAVPRAVHASATEVSSEGTGGVKTRVVAAPPAPARQKKSRGSRRRSIVMPSEAHSFMESDLGSHPEPPPPPQQQQQQQQQQQEKQQQPPTKRATVNAAAAAASGATGAPQQARERMAKRGGGNGGGGGGSSGKNAADAFPLSAVNATSCLSRALATQRGWRADAGETKKTLVRAYFAAAKGSQRARRIAARLFCLTGFCLLPVTPEDARVLCEAAGDSLEWGLEETARPRLVSRPRRLETREQKRTLVLRIKPLFALMDQAAKEEKLAVEAATGVVSRKASPDGYCYEEGDTGEPVDPSLYKAMYTKHILAVRALKLKEFSSQKAAAHVLEKEEAAAAAAAAAAAVVARAQRFTPAAQDKPSRGPPPAPVSTSTENGCRKAAGVGQGVGEDGGLPRDALNSVVGGDAVSKGGVKKAIVPEGAGATEDGAEADEAPAVGAVTSSSGLSKEDDANEDGSELSAPVIGVEAGGASGDSVAEVPMGTSIAVATRMGPAAAVDSVGGEAEMPVGGTPVVSDAVEAARASYSSAASAQRLLPVPTGDGDAAATAGQASPVVDPVKSELHAIAVVDAVLPSASSFKEDGHDQSGREGAVISGRSRGVDSPSLQGAPSKASTAEEMPCLGKGSPKEEGALRGEGCDGVGPRNACVGGPWDDRLVGVDGKGVVGSSPRVREDTTSPTASTVGDLGDDEGDDVILSPLSLSPVSFPARSEGHGEGEEAVLRDGIESRERGTQAKPPSAAGVGMPDGPTVAGVVVPEDVLGSEGSIEEMEELAALNERLWAGFDTLLLNYRTEAALIKARHRCRASEPADRDAAAEEDSAAARHSSGVVAALPAGATGGAASATRSILVSEQGSAALSARRTVPSPVAGGVTEGSAVPHGGGSGGGGASSPPVRRSAQGAGDDMLTPSSPLLPLLGLRLSEEEELLESACLRRGAGNGGGSSRVRSGKTRRRSLAQAFSSHEMERVPRRGEGGVMPTRGSAVAGENKVGVSVGGGGEGGVCGLCCTKASDSVLRPCGHSACGVCADKLRVQAEESGEVLSCPWDRQSVDEICRL